MSDMGREFNINSLNTKHSYFIRVGEETERCDPRKIKKTKFCSK